MAGALGYGTSKLDNVKRLRLDHVLGDGGGSGGDGQVADGAPQNYLLVGADDATGLDPDDPVAAGRPGGIRSDTIMVLRVDPQSESAHLVSLPRDLWVDIAGTESKDKINAAINTGGAATLISTIEANFGIPIHHYVQVNFAGFRELVEAVDGVPIYFPEPVRDRKSGLLIETRGCKVLDPVQALAFVRSRTYQVRRDGEWQGDSALPDIGRTSRQQYFIQKAIERAIAKGVRNPTKLGQLVDLGLETVTLDDDLRAQDIIDLGRRFRSFNPKTLVRMSLPVVADVKGGADVVLLKEEEAEPILAVFRGDEGDPASLPSVNPEEVQVRVENGSGAENQATEVTQGLADMGFATGPPADAEDFDGARTTIRYAPGSLGKARLVARHVAAPVAFEEMPELADSGTDVVLVTAPNFTDLLPSPKPDSQLPPPPVASTTTTTAPADGDESADEADGGDGDGPTTTEIGEVPGAPPPGVSC